MNPFTRGEEPDVERYTPPRVVAAVREALGRIDLDPASTELVNATFIRAKRIYTKASNGLDREKPWAGRVYCNPPGGSNNPRLFWERMVIEWETKAITAGVFLAFNIGQLQQSQEWDRPMLCWPFCIPAKRLVFWKEKNGQLEPREHGEFPNAILYVGRNIKRFATAFKDIGTVIVPRK
jgi:hypothetical protein